MQIRGRCHCGNVAYLFDTALDPSQIPVRACSCSFCVKHGGVWTSDTKGSLAVTVGDPSRVTRYVFGTKTAEFHVCVDCGMVPLVTCMIEGRAYAVVNVNTFEDVEQSKLRRTGAGISFDGEGVDDRLQRRMRNWIPDVKFITEAVSDARRTD